MQADLRAALASRARLAALGEAVAKINHEMRNMLTSAQMASERLAASGDPVVAAPAAAGAGAGAGGDAGEPTCWRSAKARSRRRTPRPTPLKAAVEAAAEDAQLAAGRVTLANADRRARPGAGRPRPAAPHPGQPDAQRPRGDRRRGRSAAPARVTVDLRVEEGASVVRVADDGPGLPERARANLFQPFRGSARRGGAGLGLAISRELAQAHGGDLVLVETGPARHRVRAAPARRARSAAAEGRRAPGDRSRRLNGLLLPLDAEVASVGKLAAALLHQPPQVACRSRRAAAAGRSDSACRAGCGDERIASAPMKMK